MKNEEEEMEGRQRNSSSLRSFFLFFFFCLLAQNSCFFCDQGPFCMLLSEPYYIFVEASQVTSPEFPSSSSSLSLAARNNVELKRSRRNSSTVVAAPLFSSYLSLASVSHPLGSSAGKTRRRHSPPSSFLSSPLDLFSSSFFPSPFSSFSSSPSSSSSLFSHRRVSSSSCVVHASSSPPERRFFLASSPTFSPVWSVPTPFTSSPSALPFRYSSSIVHRDLPTQTNSFIHSCSPPPFPTRDTPRHPLSSLRLSLNSNLIGQSPKREDLDGKENAKPDVAQQRVKDFVSSAPVVLFMKGTPDFPQCGFSRAIVQLLELVSCRAFLFICISSLLYTLCLQSRRLSSGLRT